MSRTPLLTALVTLAAACATPAAHAATVAADPAAQDVTTLDGTVVWVSGALLADAHAARASGNRPVTGAPRAHSYRSIDLAGTARAASS